MHTNEYPTRREGMGIGISALGDQAADINKPRSNSRKGKYRHVDETLRSCRISIGLCGTSMGPADSLQYSNRDYFRRPELSDRALQRTGHIHIFQRERCRKRHVTILRYNKKFWRFERSDIRILFL